MARWIALRYHAAQRITQTTDNIRRTVTCICDFGSRRSPTNRHIIQIDRFAVQTHEPLR
jgi:hypothetical protein